MTGVDETIQKLTAISFWVGVNNSLKNIVFTRIREKIFQVSAPVEFLIPCYDYVCMNVSLIFANVLEDSVKKNEQLDIYPNTGNIYINILLLWF